ncbi:MAG: hypothetical protein K2Y08_04500 [Alphaproteobacteria bacterium]|nr:hypothetical protein [Alphaproteobacteria bacterium]
MTSLAKSFLKLLGNSTAMMLLFLPAVSAMNEDPERDRATAASSSGPCPVDPRTNLIAGLIREVKILQAHESDAIGLIIDDDTPFELRRIIGKNLQFNENILFTLEKLQENQLSESTALKRILFLRYDFICARYKNRSIFHDSPSTQEISEYLAYDRMNLSTDRYQAYTRIILGIASMVDLRTLPPNTKKILRASPTLCSLLEDSSKDIGHPDETFMPQVLKGGPMKDREYFITHILRREKVSLTSHSSFYKKAQIVSLTPSERKFLDPEWQHPYALSELPYPEFLKPYPVKRNECAPFVTSSSSACSSSSSGYTAPSIEVSLSGPLVDVHKPADLPLRPETPKEASLPVTEESVTVSPLSSTTREFVSITPEEQKSDDSTAASSSTPPLEELRFEITQPEGSQTSELAPMRPRGMRSFHSRAPETTPNQFVPLKGKHLKTLESLFNNKLFSSVKYKKLATLWRFINGPDSIKNASSGGSHKALLDQNGKVVTGIFAHGEAQTFGKSSIQYVRDAFNQIGYGPTR